MDIDTIISKMSLEDKIALCSGANFWQTKDFQNYGIPSMFMCDGPHGLRKQENASDMLGVNKSRMATCFPAAVTTASSWDTSLLCRIGDAIAKEAKNQEVGMVLGPGANIKRNPLCGRNFEYFSEDPYLAGKLAASFINGVEKNGVATSLKHFACNSQEKDRFLSNGLIDERTLREIYLSGFEIAVKEGNPSTIMCAYPKLNGTYCSDNKTLLKDILRDEWNFNGAVITDWGAMSDRIKGFKAGCDLNMPGGSAYMEKDVLNAIKADELSEECINESAKHILKLVMRGKEAMTGEECDYNSHNSLAKEAAISGAVLLQNIDNLLPINKDEKIAIVGYMAKDMRYQGSGSSHINETSLSQPIDFFNNYEYAMGCLENGDTNNDLLFEVKEKAKNANIVIVFAGLPSQYESEGFDRDNMLMPQGHIDMINTATNANPNTIVVLMCGGVVECPWADNVKSILYMGLPGQAGGEAIASLIYGESVPSGKLSESWPYTYNDVPSSEIYGKTKDALYEEGIYIGYRYYDKAKLNVRWPFGFGLSYTKFEYENLIVKDKNVSIDVKNTGNFDGAEVVELYILAPQNGIHRPIKELKGFDKIYLKQGETKTVSFELNDRSFSIYNNGWKIQDGDYIISIGNLSSVIKVSGEQIEIPTWQSGSFYENCNGKPCISQWEKVYGTPYVPEPETTKGNYTMQNTVEEMRKHSLVMKIMYFAIKCVFKKSCGTTDMNNPEFKMLMTSSVGSPLRSMYISSGMPGGVFPGLLEMANGHFFRGIKKMLSK